MIDFGAVDLDAAYEPWKPRVGQRVRIRLSGECRAELPVECTARFAGGNLAHHPGQDGVVGTVSRPSYRIPRENLDYARRIDHPYCVNYDAPLEYLGRMWGGGNFASCELEPLDGVR